MQDALVELILDKGYGAVTVTDLINRADIGRSTFYSHFTGRQDVLFGNLDEVADHRGLVAQGDEVVAERGPQRLVRRVETDHGRQPLGREHEGGDARLVDLPALGPGDQPVEHVHRILPAEGAAGARSAAPVREHPERPLRGAGPGRQEVHRPAEAVVQVPLQHQCAQPVGEDLGVPLAEQGPVRQRVQGDRPFAQRGADRLDVTGRALAVGVVEHGSGQFVARLVVGVQPGQHAVALLGGGRGTDMIHRDDRTGSASRRRTFRHFHPEDHRCQRRPFRFRGFGRDVSGEPYIHKQIINSFD
ncbi:TetR/AcrR family transcriptional regulator [Planomonospora parontospora]|uniref:TetR/AcrR family transcriptional regulator n=1 Tax=Planomonospora parontospora TaxID=58119 RepID=UPI001944B413|nr:TetR/AcrR family transcriptional regulator [Planomonospora parontospora]